MITIALLSTLIILNNGFPNAQQLTREDIKNIPHIDNLSPVPAYFGEGLNVTINLYISNMKLEEEASQFKIYAKLMWLVSWQDNRLKGIKDEVYYFDANQIWTPEVHSYTNEIENKKVKDYYEDTIAVRQNGLVESVVFEDYEYTCQLETINVVYCNIGLAGYFSFRYNYQQQFLCSDNRCFKFTDSYLKIGNESREWNLESYSISHYLERNNSIMDFDIYFSRSVNIVYNVVKRSPIILTILLLAQFFLPIHSKGRFLINCFSYILALMMILNLQFEFFNLDIGKERDIGVFYTAALFFITLSWIWNTVSGNLWISCSHDNKPLGTYFSRVITSRYMTWLIPAEIGDSDSYLMKIIFLLDKIAAIVVAVFMIGIIIKVESFLVVWK